LIIVRREKGSTKGEEASDEWMGFVKQIKRHLDRETTKIYDNISNSTDSTTKKLEASEKE
jgi:hemerythrin-like domain-containing protein